jgi:predicted AAA+ superfamily ATPase
MLNRIIEQNIKEKLFKGKAILIFGPRQVGKTTLVRSIVNTFEHKHLWFSGDDADVRSSFSEATSTRLKLLFADAKIVVIDEAQRIENIGVCIKLVTDHIPDVQLIATGSSAFELANKINEPLTGRKYEFNLYPFSFKELSQKNGLLEETRLLENRLIYGSYPEVINSPNEERDVLKSLSESYLFKDILSYEGINKPGVLRKLLTALALQLGSEVSYNELSQTVGVDKNTVEKYIDLLEQVFIIFRLNGLNRNHRNELKKSKKVYFYDNGIRNSLLGNYLPLQNRIDTGALWENYLISERQKVLSYNRFYGHSYFWRTTQQQEIDYVEEVDGKFTAYEFKWNPNAKVKFSKAFLESYSINKTEVIHPKYFEKFLLEI